MARKPVSVFKRFLIKRHGFRYYIKLWDEARGLYSSPRSAVSLALELKLDEKAFPPTTRTGALLIGEEFRKRGGLVQVQAVSPLFADYCASIWDWENSSYIRSKFSRGQRIGRECVIHNASSVASYPFRSMRQPGGGLSSE